MKAVGNSENMFGLLEQVLYCDLQNLGFSVGEWWDFGKESSSVPWDCHLRCFGHERGLWSPN